MIDPNNPHLRNPFNTIWSPLATKQVPKEHPRLFGSRQKLQSLAKERPDAYRRTKEIAHRELTPPLKESDSTADFGGAVSVHCKMISMGLVAAIEQDQAMGRGAIDMCFKHFIDPGPRIGHEAFGEDCGNIGWVYDLAHEYWTDDEKKKF